jgi:hypothetical protein
MVLVVLEKFFTSIKLVKCTWERRALPSRCTIQMRLQEVVLALGCFDIPANVNELVNAGNVSLNLAPKNDTKYN